MCQKHIRYHAFTLVEIIFVVAIIGILMSLLLPGISAVRRNAAKVQDAANLKKIVEAWQIYVDRFQEPLNGTYNGKPCGTKFIENLAGYGRTKDDIIINNLNIFFSNGDKYSSSLKQDFFVQYTDSSGIINTQSSPWSIISNELHNYSHAFSYCVANNLPISAPRETTPFAFTRGLCTDGKWHETYGLYGSSGGYVVFCDGHVTWFDGNKPARFLKWDHSGYSNNILEAIPKYCTFTCLSEYSHPIVKNKDGGILITVGDGLAEDA